MTASRGLDVVVEVGVARRVEPAEVVEVGVELALSGVGDGDDDEGYGIDGEAPVALGSGGALAPGAGEAVAAAVVNRAPIQAPRAAQETTRIAWSVSFSRRPPDAVTVTMSSIRTPNRPGR